MKDLVQLRPSIAISNSREEFRPRHIRCWPESPKIDHFAEPCSWIGSDPAPGLMMQWHPQTTNPVDPEHVSIISVAWPLVQPKSRSLLAWMQIWRHVKVTWCTMRGRVKFLYLVDMLRTEKADLMVVSRSLGCPLLQSCMQDLKSKGITACEYRWSIVPFLTV